MYPIENQKRKSTDYQYHPMCDQMVYKKHVIGFDVIGQHYFWGDDVNWDCQCQWSYRVHGIICPEHQLEGLILIEEHEPVLNIDLTNMVGPGDTDEGVITMKSKLPNGSYTLSTLGECAKCNCRWASINGIKCPEHQVTGLILIEEHEPEQKT